MKKLLLLSTLCTSLFLCGCVSSSYNEFDDKAWLQEQVDKGYLTQEEVNEILAGK